MRLNLKTRFPVAVNSLDHIEPLGTKNDNSKNRNFNSKIYKIFPGRTVSVLDLGCAGGGMVKSFIDDGHIAYGLEGSDYNRIHGMHEWMTIPENLMTCDITQIFSIEDENGDIYKFDVITAWEVLEHLYEIEIVRTLKNVRNHLKDTGLFIGSITNEPYPHHITCEPMSWWDDLFEANGFIQLHGIERFIDRDWVRSVDYNFVYKKRVQ